jgi:hypothetical protein
MKYMTNSKNIKLNIFLYRYMNEIIKKNHYFKKEKTSNMDNNFKEDLKQHFRALTQIDKNNMKLEM